MTAAEYKTFADNLAQKAGVENGLHSYFRQHRDRLWQTANHFGIWDLRGKKILEIGPFFSYTPFVLRNQDNDVVVLEGSDPAVEPLQKIYADAGINFIICDLFESFGASSIEKHRLPFAENQFDVICCWETMEHFNFNPTGFVRDVYRVLKPGGKVFITVPNMAELENRVKLFRGQSICMPAENFPKFYNYGGGRFLGFHWREYVLSEIDYLFRSQNFSVLSAKHLLAFQNHPQLSLVKRIKRAAAGTAFKILPSTGNICAIAAQKI